MNLEFLPRGLAYHIDEEKRLKNREGEALCSCGMYFESGTNGLKNIHDVYLAIRNHLDEFPSHVAQIELDSCGSTVCGGRLADRN